MDAATLVMVVDVVVVNWVLKMRNPCLLVSSVCDGWRDMGDGKTVLTLLCGSPHFGGGGFWAVVPFGNCVLWVRCFNVVCNQVTIFLG